MRLFIAAAAAAALFAGCEKYDDPEQRKEIQETSDKLDTLEAWCHNSQAAIDAAAVLQTAVDGMASVESIEPFKDANGATGYVITFTNEQAIKLYNGKQGEPGASFFGIIIVCDDRIEFTLQDGRVFIIPRGKVTPDYLYFEAVEAGAIVKMEIVGKVDVPSLEYSTDRSNWTAYDFKNPKKIVLGNIGDRVYWRNTDKTDHFTKDIENFIWFNLGEKKIAAGGNIMSLIDKSCQTLTVPSAHCFNSLFISDTTLVSAPELPATELADYCYFRMFLDCASLKKTPALPATVLAEGCYCAMFGRCYSLTEAFDLPAKQLAPYCYQQMFEGCRTLEKAPALPATELAEYCYFAMFDICYSLIEAPALPATELELCCYKQMFEGCESLEKAPVLPATELATGCYYGMFEGCTSLATAPELPATTLASNCYGGMFSYTAIAQAPELPARNLAEYCYVYLFENCKNLKNIKVSFDDWGDGMYTYEWVSRVPSGGLFECPAALEVEYDISHIPAGWSVNGAEAADVQPSTEVPAGLKIKHMGRSISAGPARSHKLEGLQATSEIKLTF